MTHRLRALASAVALAVTLTLAACATQFVAPSSPAGMGLTPADAAPEQPDRRTAHVPDLPEVEDDATGRPNIVLITTDDQSVTDLRWMPRTTRLLRDNGVDFSSMLSPHPLCCPARAEILTGQYAQNNGVHSNGGPYGGYPALRDKEETLGTWLYRSGYRTGMIGKFLNQYQARTGFQPGWEYWNVAANNAFGYRSFKVYDNGVERSFRESEGLYSSDYITDHTVEQIEEWSPGDQPFFLWSSYYAPHGLCGEEPGCNTPPQPAPRHDDLFRGVDSPHLAARSARVPFPRDGSPAVRHSLRNLPSKAALQRHFTRRIQALQAVDEGVARIVEALAAQGELDNTYLLFTSDNGFLVGEHHYLGKTVPYEEAVRVPLFVRGPGVPADVVRRRAVTTVDLAPTIAAIGGATPGRTVDGRSLLPLLDPTATPLAGDTVLLQGGPPSQETDPPPWMYRGVRTDRYTFITWKMYAGGRRFYELYDRRKDPHQLDNLWRDRGYRKVRTELLERTKTLATCSGTGACFRDFGAVPSPD